MSSTTDEGLHLGALGVRKMRRYEEILHLPVSFWIIAVQEEADGSFSMTTNLLGIEVA
jgi:hypothetical protein